MTIDADLAALAAEYGIATEYWDQVRMRHVVDGSTVVAVLAAFGVDANTAASRRAAIKEARRRHWEAVLPAIRVVRQSPDAEVRWQCWVHVPQGATVRVWVELDDGGLRFDVTELDRRGDSFVTDDLRIDEYLARLPTGLPLGWHRVLAEIDGGEQHTCPLVVCPARLEIPRHASLRRAWGIATQIYSARSRRSWGVGDLVDLDDIAAWSGRDLGADFVLVNPMHACAPVVEQTASPYLPATRRYSNPIYVRVEAVEEYAYLSDKDRRKVTELAEPLLAAGLTSDLLDRNATWQAKREALALVHAVPRSIGRQADYRDYVESQGEDLERFALWCALTEEFGPYWVEWPPALRDADSAAVAEQAQLLHERVEFYQWTQWIVDEQLGRVGNTVAEAGMSIGVMHDLAVGVQRHGADTWVYGDLFAAGMTVGAPPDGFNQVGQDWSQPPMRPDLLAAAGYAPFRDMLRTLLRHSGGIRVDHILGLFRLWWIPEGQPPHAGTYVRYDHEALTDILVLEAHQAGALIVGEDLGTVEPWVADFLAERGILGTSVLWFERDDDGPTPPERWRSDAMVAVTVHDLPPTGAYIAGSHVNLRAELGLLNREASVEAAEHKLEINRWRELLVRLGLGGEKMTDGQMVVALHRLASWSPARLLAVALPDLVGDLRTQNQPGTDEQYPNWRIPLCGPDGQPVLIDDLPARPELASIVAAIGGPANYRPG